MLSLIRVSNNPSFFYKNYQLCCPVDVSKLMSWTVNTYRIPGARTTVDLRIFPQT